MQAVNRKFSLRFEPVDSQWRRNWAERLQLPLAAVEKATQASVVSKEMSYDDRPTRMAGMVADGNCLFRALSHVITLKQKSHVKMRQLVGCHRLFLCVLSFAHHTHVVKFNNRVDNFRRFGLER